jgi:hypothetical protein
MTLTENITIIENNIKKINELYEIVSKKTNEVSQKIDNFNKKKSLKLDDSTPFLIYQNKILHNELSYLNNHKQIIDVSLNSMLQGISENISMMSLTLLTMYKEDLANDNKLVKISSNKDFIVKIVADITHNLDLIKGIIEGLRKYNSELNDSVTKSNFHVYTLNENVEFICSHMELEYKKHLNDIEKTLEYFVNYTNKIIEQNENMVLLKFVS